MEEVRLKELLSEDRCLKLPVVASSSAIEFLDILSLDVKSDFYFWAGVCMLLN